MVRLDPEYLRWGVILVSALGAWRFLPLAVVRLVAALTRDDARHRRCAEVLRLARRDAAHITSYTSDSLLSQPREAPDARDNAGRREKADYGRAVRLPDSSRARPTVPSDAPAGRTRSRRKPPAPDRYRSRPASH